MEVEPIERDGCRYIESLPGQGSVSSEADALELIGLCHSHGARCILLHAANLSPDFFDLSTRLAGEVLQKLRLYHIRLAVVAGPELSRRGKFAELMVEESRGRHFGVFDAVADAEAWLIEFS